MDTPPTQQSIDIARPLEADRQNLQVTPERVIVQGESLGAVSNSVERKSEVIQQKPNFAAQNAVGLTNMNPVQHVPEIERVLDPREGAQCERHTQEPDESGMNRDRRAGENNGILNQGWLCIGSIFVSCISGLCEDYARDLLEGAVDD